MLPKDYLDECMKGINEMLDAESQKKIAALIHDSYNRSIAPAEVNAWIKHMLGIHYMFSEKKNGSSK
jgi:hypothetical protein